MGANVTMTPEEIKANEIYKMYKSITGFNESAKQSALFHVNSIIELMWGLQNEMAFYNKVKEFINCK
jgi:hypothetical protein